LFLDYKCAEDAERERKLGERDHNNLAKAITGFGNLEGGVIIWGVGCSRDIDKGDLARDKCPIHNVSRFVSWLENAVSGCTIPPHRASKITTSKKMMEKVGSKLLIFQKVIVLYINQLQRSLYNQFNS